MSNSREAAGQAPPSEVPTSAVSPTAPKASSGKRVRYGMAEIVRQSLPVLGPDKRMMPALIALCFVLSLVEASLVYLVVQMAVGLASGKETFEFVLGPVAVRDIGIERGSAFGAVLAIGLIAFLVPVARTSGRLPAKAQERVRQILLDAYLGANWEVRSRFPEGHLQELLTTYASRAERAITQLVAAAIAICGLTAILLTAFVASPVAAASSIVCVVGVGALLRPLLVRMRAAGREFADSDRYFAGRAAEIARMTPEVAAFDVASEVSDRVALQAAEVSKSFERIRTLQRLGTGMYQYLALLLVLVALGAAAAVADGPELATVGGVFLLLVRALAYGQQLQAQVQLSQETAPFLERMRDEIASLRAAEVRRTGIHVDSPMPLEFRDVHFGYSPGSEVLRGISFTVEPGESLGIIGRSGAGKSTIVQLLLRLWTPTSGVILSGGRDLAEVAPERWSELVSYVPQENKLIRGTVADNIRFFRPDLTDDAVRSAATRAHLHDEIMQLPGGYDTEVGPGARDLSGGQRQRLGIARALAGSPLLVVLDEPTSALDARSEHLITETLQGLHGTVSTIVVAHRPATLAVCDHVLRVDDGRGEFVAVETHRATEMFEAT